MRDRGANQEARRNVLASPMANLTHFSAPAIIFQARTSSLGSNGAISQIYDCMEAECREARHGGCVAARRGKGSAREGRGAYPLYNRRYGETLGDGRGLNRATIAVRVGEVLATPAIPLSRLDSFRHTPVFRAPELTGLRGSVSPESFLGGIRNSSRVIVKRSAA